MEHVARRHAHGPSGRDSRQKGSRRRQRLGRRHAVQPSDRGAHERDPRLPDRQLRLQPRRLPELLGQDSGLEADGPRRLEHQPQPFAQRALQHHQEQVFVRSVQLDQPAEQRLRPQQLRPYVELRHVFRELALLPGAELHLGRRRAELALHGWPSDQHAPLHLLASVRAAQLRRRHLPDRRHPGELRRQGHAHAGRIHQLRSRSLHRG